MEFEEEFEKYKSLVLEKMSKQRPGTGSSKKKERFDRDFEKTKALLASRLENLPDISQDMWEKEMAWLERHQNPLSIVEEAELKFTLHWLREHRVRVYSYLAAMTKTFLAAVPGEQGTEFRHYFSAYFQMFMIKLLRVVVDVLVEQQSVDSLGEERRI